MAKKNKVEVKLRKTPTGISGFDEITGGGIPTGRPTLVCGGPGCGKSLFAAEFLMRGVVDFDEPGVLMTFEESAEDIKTNVASLGFDLEALVRKKKILIDHANIRRSEIEENGEYNLDGLFIRLSFAIELIGAKRVVLDTIETLFAGLSDQGVLRAEIRRLFEWLKDRGMTTVITGESGGHELTRQGLEEYVSDCVVVLDHRLSGQVSTRRLRVVKYRGSFHGTNEYPFLIDEKGLSVLPITHAVMDYRVSGGRVSSGIPALDEMLGGKGFYRDSNVLLTGTAGTGKTSLAAHFADATCRRGERCLFFSFEESPDQIVRNMGSVGLRLDTHLRKGLLEIHSSRPTDLGFEMHLLRMQRRILEFKPSAVIVDPVFDLPDTSMQGDATNMLIRLIDLLRRQNITGFIVNLINGRSPFEVGDHVVGSLIDTWILLRDFEQAGERSHALCILKSRGMAHSKQVRGYQTTSRGITLSPFVAGSAEVARGTLKA